MFILLNIKNKNKKKATTKYQKKTLGRSLKIKARRMTTIKN
jgi:hypothetical protein